MVLQGALPPHSRRWGMSFSTNHSLNSTTPELDSYRTEPTSGVDFSEVRDLCGVYTNHRHILGVQGEAIFALFSETIIHIK